MASSSSSNYSSLLSLLPKPSQHSVHAKRFKVSCKAKNINDGEEHHKNLDRRNVLMGLGGLYGGAVNLSPLATAAPIPPPDLNSCTTAHITDDGPDVPYSCCPPRPDDIDSVPYYKLPPVSKLRKRPAAQNVDDRYIAKYQLATSRMKELDMFPSDPLGFRQQANIHCAYCNGAYRVGGKDLQVHNSWLFFPFHRWYLYFYERILGSLIDDPTFALPYWNWDNPKGMSLPPMFDNRQGYPSLYDQKRDPNHLSGTIMDLGYFGTDAQTNELQTRANNLTLMYRQMVTNAPTPRLFFGEKYILGSDPDPGAGTIENIPHTPVHIWVGTKRDVDNGKYGEDMGNFYSAAKDPVFFCHHSNVDRMWVLWKKLGGKRKNIVDEDWLNSEFFFYDENRNPFRVKVGDCLDHKKMGYDYEPMPTPWRKFKPQKKKITRKLRASPIIPPANKVFPISKLDKGAICFSIDRPASSRTQQDKGEKEEILKFTNVKHEDSKYIRFDVFLNADNNVNADELDKPEYAGSYTSLPHVHGDQENVSRLFTTNFQLAITELLEDNDLEGEDNIVVTLVPKKGGQYTSIEGVEIKLEIS